METFLIQNYFYSNTKKFRKDQKKPEQTMI